jgi:hypothetical protein
LFFFYTKTPFNFKGHKLAQSPTQWSSLTGAQSLKLANKYRPVPGRFMHRHQAVIVLSCGEFVVIAAWDFCSCLRMYLWILLDLTWT